LDQPDDLRIVPLSGADEDRLQRFYASLEPAVVWFYEPYGAAPAKEKIREVLAAVDAGRDVAFGLENPAGEIVGHVFIADLASGSPTFGIGMAASAHGRGWGRRLAETALAEVDAAGLPLVALTVVKANVRASSLYKSLGFEIAGECTFRTERDSYVMHRRRP
jgi:ribosomal protein S18 acetylase RimI-like enzyme